MQHKSVFQYFFKGFSLINKSLDIFLIGLSLSLSGLLINFFISNTIFGIVLFILSVVLVFIDIGFFLSLPFFLIQKQQKEALDYGKMVGVVLKNTRRIVLPIILFVLIFFAVMLILLFIHTVISLRPNSAKSEEEIISYLQNISKGWHPITLIPLALLSFLGFTSFFFSLENNGLLSSLKKSTIAGFNNLNYISILILISIISYSFFSLMPMETFWGQLILMTLGGYIPLVLTASSLFYYQNVIKIPQDSISKGSGF